MKKVILVHGVGGSGQNHWFPWLKKKLEKQGFLVDAQDYPETDTPNLEKWTGKLLPKIEKDCVLIGHSLGVSTILKALEKYKGEKVLAVFSIAGFARHLELDFSPLIDNFTEKGFDFEKIKQKIGSFFIWESDDDPFVSGGEGDFLYQNLGGTKQIFPKRDHLAVWGNDEKFIELLDKIIQL
ncbi:serine hydrolase family protein [Candidatus Gracilibacteria bacterium]|nr:serine hydrolase family protein [Candidatus Gracilibacteria bacterium]